MFQDSPKTLFSSIILNLPFIKSVQDILLHTNVIDKKAVAQEVLLIISEVFNDIPGVKPEEEPDFDFNNLCVCDADDDEDIFFNEGFEVMMTQSEYV